MLLTLPLIVLFGNAFSLMSADSPSRTLAISFSYTSQTIHTVVKSEIVNGFGDE